MRILVAEDQIGQLMVRILAKICPDAEVRLELNGVSGLRAYSEFKPDLVISDWNMPRMNGGYMAENIRKLAPRQKIILWSASLPETFKGYTHHFDAIVAKDISMWDLQEIIAGVMKDSGLENSER